MSSTKRIKVVHLSTDLLIGGAEKMLCRLVGRVDRTRFDSVVISLMGVGPLGEELAAAGFRVHSLEMRRGRPSLGALTRLVQVLRRERPDILQTWLYHADLMGLVAGRLARVPRVVWNIRSAGREAAEYNRLARLTLLASARLARFPSAVVVNSEAGRVYHSDLGYHPRSWHVVPNGFDTVALRPDDTTRRAVRRELGLAPDATVIGLVARFDPVKDHETFIRAGALLATAHPEVRFLLVGLGVDAANGTLMSWITEGGLEKNIHLLGVRRDIGRIMAALDFAVCSSLSEGFSTVVGEAMACGVPCVVTDVGDSALLVGDTGVVVPARDPAALAAGMRRVVELRGDARADLGRRARARIEQHFGLDSVVRRYEELYVSLVGGEPCAA